MSMYHISIHLWLYMQQFYDFSPYLSSNNKINKNIAHTFYLDTICVYKMLYNSDFTMKESTRFNTSFHIPPNESIQHCLLFGDFYFHFYCCLFKTKQKKLCYSLSQTENNFSCLFSY